MYTLLLRLIGDWCAAGTERSFQVRSTEDMLTKSEMVGLLAAALGRKRTDSIDDLAAMRYAVRSDRKGEMFMDAQTASRDGKPYYFHKCYLADAAFLVGFESDDKKFLEKLLDAVRHPVFALYIGRKNCLPIEAEGPIGIGIREGLLEEVMEQEEPVCWNPDFEGRVEYECRPGDHADRWIYDQPISFDPVCRKFAKRPVKVRWLYEEVPDEEDMEEDGNATAEEAFYGA